MVTGSKLRPIAATLLVLVSTSAGMCAESIGTENGQWSHYGGDLASSRYSPLDQIDATNFSDLEIAWRWPLTDAFVSRNVGHGGELWAPLAAIVDSLVADTPNLYRTGHAPNYSAFQSTPLMVGGVLYFNTPLSQGVAVDGRHGRSNG